MNINPLKQPYGPNVPEPQHLGSYTPVDWARNSPSLASLRDQPTSREWNDLMLSPTRPGTDIGGPTIRQQFDLMNPGGFTLNGPQIPYDKPLLLDLHSPRDEKLGNFSFDFLDLGGNYEAFMSGTLGLPGPGVGDTGYTGFDPARFLAEKNIDLFGTGSTGAPSRLADYAISFPLTLAQRALGIGPNGDPTKPQVNTKFAFQADPRYWAFLGQTPLGAAGDQAMHDLSKSIAADNVGDPYAAQLEGTLFDQMKADQQQALGLSSGDARTDYFTLLNFQAGLAHPAPPPPPAAAPTGDLVHDVLNFLARGAGVDQPQQPSKYDVWGTPKDPLFPAMGTIPQLINPETGMPSGQTAFLLSQVPFLGDAIGKNGLAGHGAIPIEASTMDAWQNLTPEERQKRLQGEQMYQTGFDVAEMAITFGGVSALRGIAAAGKLGLVGQRAAYTYDVVMKLANLTMATGLTAALANWSAEAAVPGYEESIGQYVDYSRPVSGSAVAGLANWLGFFASGTYGTAQAVRLYRAGAGKLLDIAAEIPGAGRVIPRPLFGLKEFQFDRFAFGGGSTRSFVSDLSNGALDGERLRVPIIRTFVSHAMNGYQNAQVRMFMTEVEDAISNPASRSDLAPLARDNLPAFYTAVDTKLQLIAESTPYRWANLIKSIAQGHRDLSPLALDSTEQAQRAVSAVAKTTDDLALQNFTQKYNTAWSHLADAESRRVETRRLLGELGVTDVNEAKLANVGKNHEKDTQLLNLLYQVSYDRKFATMLSAAQGSEEASKIAMFSQRTLFRDEAEEALQLLRGVPVENATLPADAQQLIEWLFRKETVAQHFLGNTADMTPGKLANWLEDVHDMLPGRREIDPELHGDGALNDFQRSLEDEGRWTIGFKPKRNIGAPAGEAGPLEESITGVTRESSDFASLRRLRDGTMFKSPWADYPIGSLDQIELGNRGVLGSLFDSATMGTRAWRIGEYQRANLHRLIQTRYRGITREQIDALHTEIRSLASEPHYSLREIHIYRSMQGWAHDPKSIGIAEKIFGKGELVLRSGGTEIPDWQNLMAKAYTQSMRMNFLAGLTSRLKAAPLVGPAAVAIGEDMYLLFRFGLSPIFKASERVESKVFNFMRGVGLGDDPISFGMYTNSMGLLTGQQLKAELGAGDSLLGGLGTARGEGATLTASYISPGQEQAIAGAAQTRSPGMPRLRPLEQTIPGAKRRPGRSTNYTQATPADMLPAGVRPGARAGGASTRRLLNQQTEQLVNSLPPEQLLQAQRMQAYTGRLALEWPMGHIQPMRVHPANTAGRFSAPVMLKQSALEKMVPVFRDVTGDVAITPAAITGLRELEILDKLGRTNGNVTLRDALTEFAAGDSKVQTGARALDQDWADVDSVFLTTADVPRWTEFKAKFPDDHPIQQVAARFFDGSQLGMEEAMTQLAAERAGIADLLSRPLKTFANIDVQAERVARRISGAIDTEGFAQALQDVASKNLGYDAGLPMIRSYLRYDPQIQGDQLIISVNAGDGGKLGLNLADINDVWQAHGLPATFGHFVGEDATAYLRANPGPAVAWEYVEGTPGKLHVYEKPSTELINAAIVKDPTSQELRWLDPNHRSLDIVFTSNFSPAGRSYQPLSDLYPRYDVGKAIFERSTSTVHYKPEGKPGWSYGVTTHENFVEIKPGGEDLASHSAEELIRDAIARHPNKTVFIHLTDDNLAEAYGRLWLRGELPSTVAADFTAKEMVRPWADLHDDVRSAFAGTLVREGKWFHGSSPPHPGTGEWQINAPLGYYTTNSLRDAEWYASQSVEGAQIRGRGIGPVRVVDAPKKPLDITAMTPESIRFMESWRSQIAPLLTDAQRVGDRAVTMPEFIDKWGDTLAKWSGIDRAEFNGLAAEGINDIRAGSLLQYIDELIVDGKSGRVTSYDNLSQDFAGRLSLWAQEILPRQRIDALKPPIHWVQGQNVLRQSILDGGYDALLTREMPMVPGPQQLSDFAKRIDVMIYLNGRPEAKTVEQLWQERNPGKQVQKPFDLAELRSRHAVPRELADAQLQAEGDAANLAGNREQLLSQVESALKAGPAPKRGRLNRFEKWLLDPVPMKQGEEAKLAAFFQKNTFADFLQQIQPDMYDFYTKELGVPRHQLTDFKVEDRWLYEQWVASGDMASFDKFVGHASKYTGKAESAEALREFYSSPEWSVISDLWLMNARTVSQEAFTTHFFTSYRGALERSLNHPVLGLFPLSWAMKAAREWALFLYNNRSLTGLKIGMAPAVALKTIQRNEDQWWAQHVNDERLSTFVGYHGPLQSSFLIFNLMMPGDWSSIPTPLAAPIRDVVRGDFSKLTNPLEYMGSLGLGRDWRLFTEAAQQGQAYLSNALNPPPPTYKAPPRIGPPEPLPKPPPVELQPPR